MSHASILETCLINLLPYRVTEHTNFGAAENPLAVLINTDTCMNACTASVHNDMRASHGHVLARATATVHQVSVMMMDRRAQAHGIKNGSKGVQM